VAITENRVMTNRLKNNLLKCQTENKNADLKPKMASFVCILLAFVCLYASMTLVFVCMYRACDVGLFICQRAKRSASLEISLG